MRQLTRLDMFGFKVESKALEVQSVVTFGAFRQMGSIARELGCLMHWGGEVESGILGMAAPTVKWPSAFGILIVHSITG